MKTKIAEGDPKSWLFQWYTHQPPSAKTGEINRIYPNATDPNRALAQDMWDTCQAHHFGDDPNMFLPWHRMYVYFFERIVRSVLNDMSFTLPYWDYTNTVFVPDQRSIPLAFRSVGSPLFQANRRAPNPRQPTFPNVNNGDPIWPPGVLNLESLQQQTYGRNGLAPGFNEHLDDNLHAAVHVGVGDPSNMGGISGAANDPIFWLHHCNIDRIWASWNRPGFPNTPVDQSVCTFVFVDADGTRVAAKVSDFSRIDRLGYVYDHLELVLSASISTSPLVAAAAAERTVTELAVQSDPDAITLETIEPIRVALAAPADVGGSSDSLIERFRAISPEQSVYLVLQNVHASQQPGILYSVYIYPSTTNGASRVWDSITARRRRLRRW